MKLQIRPQIYTQSRSDTSLKSKIKQVLTASKIQKDIAFCPLHFLLLLQVSVHDS